MLRFTWTPEADAADPDLYQKSSYIFMLKFTKSIWITVFFSNFVSENQQRPNLLAADN